MTETTSERYALPDDLAAAMRIVADRDVLYSDDRCEQCNRILDCCGNCPKCGTRKDRQ